jgi:hypothetical protein
MQETHVQEDVFAREEPQVQQSVEPRRRIAEEQHRERRLNQQVFDFSKVDFSRPEVKQSVTRAANILIDRANRRRLGGA